MEDIKFGIVLSVIIIGIGEFIISSLVRFFTNNSLHKISPLRKGLIFLPSYSHEDMAISHLLSLKGNLY